MLILMSKCEYTYTAHINYDIYLYNSYACVYMLNIDGSVCIWMIKHTDTVLLTILFHMR